MTRPENLTPACGVPEMSDRRPTPLFIAPARPLCSVCGSPSYSAAGMHPQCAMHLADAPRVEELRAERKRQKTRGNRYR